VFELAVNHREHVLELRQDLIVPESHHLESLSHQEQGAFCVTRRLLDVLPTIELDDEPPLDANEIHDVAADGHLAPKLVTVELPIAHAIPQPLLRIGRSVPQDSRDPC
jgi:hypothetical protein